jgi:hypothetical protein
VQLPLGAADSDFGLTLGRVIAPLGANLPSLTGSARLSYITSHFDDTSVQPRDGVER